MFNKWEADKQMLRITLTLIFCFILLSQNIFAQSTEQALKETCGRIKNLQSFKANMIMDIDGKTTKQHFQGDLFSKASVGMRLNMGTAMLMIINIKSNTVWTYIPEQKMVTKINLDKLSAVLGLSSQQLEGFTMQNPKDPYCGFKKESVKLLRKETLDGEPTYVFEGVMDSPIMKFIPQQTQSSNQTEGTFWISTRDGMIRKIISNTSPTDKISILFNHIQLNPVVNDSDFQFNPPQGIEVMDMTQMLEQMMQPSK